MRLLDDQCSRVVVTGLAVETCIGRGVPEFWTNLAAGRSGIRPLKNFDASNLPCKVGGEMDFDPLNFMTPSAVRRTSRFQQLLYCCVAQALENVPGVADSDRTALVVGTGGGAEPYFGLALANYAQEGWKGLDRLSLLKTLPNMAAAYVAQAWQIRGPVLTVATACASSADAIATGVQLIRSGQADVVICAGAEAWLTELSIGNFCLMQAVSTRSSEQAQRASRPFDKGRDGMVPAEGAGVVIIESLGHARKFDREILAEVLGAASTCDGHHLVQPHPTGAGAVRAMTNALRDAELAPDQIDHVNMHGTSTPLNDRIETAAMKQVLGEHARSIPFTASKSIFGHASGAAGAIEAVATIQTIRQGFVPPTLNLDEPDPDCDLDYTPHQGRSARIERAMTVNFGFGGQNAALIFGKFQDAV